MGQLFYIIGASGVGKDSVIEYARNKINGSFPVIFTHRYITRAADAGGENHVALTKEEFNSRLRGGLFALHWESHGFLYGVGKEATNWLESGYNVVVNGSREYLPEARKKFKNLVAILITAKPETLRERLIRRGRESTEEIEKRIRRSQQISIDTQQLIEIPNDDKLEVAGQKLAVIVSTTN